MENIDNRIDIKSMTIEELEELLVSMGDKKFRGKQIFSWLHEKLVVSFDDMTNLSKPLREKLEEKCAKGKCDDEDLADLAAARASAESAQTALDAANQKANAFYAQDEDEAAAEYMAERDAQEASIAVWDAVSVRPHLMAV